MHDYLKPDPDPAPRRRWGDRRCQCDGAHLGACPGPENCPNSGLGPEQPEGEKEDDEAADHN